VCVGSFSYDAGECNDSSQDLGRICVLSAEPSIVSCTIISRRINFFVMQASGDGDDSSDDLGIAKSSHHSKKRHKDDGKSKKRKRESSKSHASSSEGERDRDSSPDHKKKGKKKKHKRDKRASPSDDSSCDEGRKARDLKEYKAQKSDSTSECGDRRKGGPSTRKIEKLLRDAGSGLLLKVEKRISKVRCKHDTCTYRYICMQLCIHICMLVSYMQNAFVADLKGEIQA
jgi:hypothetical protein